MKPERDHVIAGHFRLITELASGNMGSVWLADHLGLGVRCAVKLMAHAALRDPRSRARFELEARAVARLQSPHIVRVLDYDVDDDTPFIAMELLQGEDLAARIARLGRLEPAVTLAVVTQIAQGLSKAHAIGIVHRDLKPENVFLANTDEGEIAKILDFGIAKVMSPGSSSGTLDGQVLGTPQYMSPEQVRGATTIDQRSDLWSLAVVTYHCLLGRLPFDGAGLGDVFARIVADPIPVPSRVASPDVHLPPGFDGWWARAVSRDVDRRFGSARELVEALRPVLDGEPHAVESPADVTTPPVAVSTTPAVDEPVVLPMRPRWRPRLVVAAAAIGVAAVATLGHVRTTRGTARAEGPSTLALVVPPSLPAPDERLLAPKWIPEVSVAAASSATPPAAGRPKAPRASHASLSKKMHPRPSAPAVARVIAPVPAPAVELPATAASGAPSNSRPADDIDFGI